MLRTALIVAGGKGLRMGGELPKQFLPIGGIPVLMRTIDAFHRYDSEMQLILVLPCEQQAYWQMLCWEHQFAIKHSIADGGETRFHSVKNGLALVKGSGLVGVHDGVRPFVSQEVIGRCYEQAATKQAVVPVIDVVETLRHLTGEVTGIENATGKCSGTVNRSEYRLVQTPQVFDAGLLRRAYEQEFTSFFTDDASVVEALDVPIFLVEGNRENIKITTPFDLKVGSALI